MLTVITAAHRNPEGLRALHAALAGGLGDDLRWQIQDSGACADTQAWAADIDGPGFDFRAEPDDGIYDALNKAIARLRTPYYLVVGSDDAVDPAALLTIAAGLKVSGIGTVLTTGPEPHPGPDILTFPVLVDGHTRRRQPLWPAQVNILGLTASHSVGTVIRTALHERLGLYDTRYRILADSLFLRRAQLAGCRFEHHDSPIPGRFATTGISHRDHGRLMWENLSYNIECGSSRLLQSVMFMVRMAAYRPRSFL